MSENKIVKVSFHGGEIEATKAGEDAWVSVRRICEHLDIDAKTQQDKLKEKKWAVRGLIPSTGTVGELTC
jgi:hypothetical protein